VKWNPALMVTEPQPGAAQGREIPIELRAMSAALGESNVAV
jgi:hypothetical protein